MGKSMVINCGEIEVDKEFEKGFGIFPYVSAKTCGSQNVTMGVCVHTPGSRNQEHVHNNIEVIWFTITGHSLHYSCTVDHEEYFETECFPGTIGYVHPGEIHVGMNLNADDTGSNIFCYLGANMMDQAGTVFYQDVGVVADYMEKHGRDLRSVLSEAGLQETADFFKNRDN